jgi:hypothetical protein
MATADDVLVLHSNLSKWIELNGGCIHNNLALHTPSPSDVTDGGQRQDKNQQVAPDYTRRGIFALHGQIAKGEELIRLPVALALDGHALPVSYYDSSASVINQPRNASNWLRCVSSLMHTFYQSAKATEAQSVKYSHYIASLPKRYDSLLNWTTWEIRSFLAGTALGMNVTATPIESPTDGRSEDALRIQFRKSVVPYLNYLQQNLGLFQSDDDSNSNNKIDTNERGTKRQKRAEEVDFEQLYPLFREGCMCISSRAFHMQLQPDTANSDYHGPYLLPYIDLLNHSPQTSPKHVTTLRRDPTDGSFVMMAERDIAIGEEICHSYDVGDAVDGTIKQHESSSSLTSAQMLQTFGFVDVERQRRMIDFFLEAKDRHDIVSNSNDAVVTMGSSITSAVLTKSELCEACEEISKSTYTHELRNLMERSGLLEEGWEYWDLPSLSNWVGARGNALKNLPDEILVSLDASLADELITICCLNFLPDFTLDELLNDEQTVLLNTEVLEDFFLGKLVLQAIINAVKTKLTSYKVQINLKEDADDSALLRVLKKVFENDECSSICWGENEVSDAKALLKLTSSNSRNQSGIDKFIYGLVVSLEERACLMELRKKTYEMIVQI